MVHMRRGWLDRLTPPLTQASHTINYDMESVDLNEDRAVDRYPTTYAGMKEGEI